LAQKLAKFHSIKMPIPKDSSKEGITNMCDVWYDENLRKLLTEGIIRQAVLAQNRKTLSTLDFYSELQWIKNAILSSNCPVMFTHCDFNRGNILIRDQKTESDNNLDIFLIDFDYSSNNYRGIDIGRYFSSWGHKDPMFGFGEFPTDDQMSVFINAYIEESKKLLGNSYAQIEVNSRENIIKEAKLFTLYCLLIDVLFSLWSINEDNTKMD